MSKLISITEAATLGVDRLRLPVWADKMDHLKLDIVDGKPGPWLHLFAPFNKKCNGRDPVDFLWAMGAMKTDINFPEFEVYSGPLPDSEEYKLHAGQFAGVL